MCTTAGKRPPLPVPFNLTFKKPVIKGTSASEVSLYNYYSGGV